MARPERTLQALALVGLIFCLFFAGFFANKTRPDVATSDSGGASGITKDDFEKAGFGELQSELLARVLAGDGTATDSRRLQILEQIRHRNYELKFSTATDWDSQPLKTDWVFDAQGNFIDATVSFPGDAIRASDRYAAAYKATSQHTPMLIGLMDLFKEACDSERTAERVIDGFQVTVSATSKSMVQLRVSVE